MVTITYCDPNLSVRPAADLTLTESSAYAGGYARILEAVYQSQPLRVIITDRSLKRWFDLMAARYGPDSIRFQEITLRSLLEERIGIPVPAEIQDREIISSELLDLNIPATSGISFDDYLLEVFLGGFLIKSDPLLRVSEILAAYEPEQWQAALERPLVKKAYTRKLNSLREEASHAGMEAQRELLAWFERSPLHYLRNLATLKLLSGYPGALGQRVFGSVYSALVKAGLDLRKVPLELRENELVLDEIRVHLHALSQQPSAEVYELLLEQTSGLLEIELEAVLETLRSGNIPISASHIQQVRRKFTALQDRPLVAQALNDLEVLISVPKPSQPDPAWTEDAWLRWAVEEYLPYRFWLENTNRLDDQIGETAGLFSDWLFEHYSYFLYNSKSMAWRAMLELKERIKAHTGPVLVVVLDNFNLKFYPVLQRHLQQIGLYEQTLQPCLAVLPSFTAISKKAVITGTHRPFDGTNYAAAIDSAWSSRLGKSVRYVANISELRKIDSRSHDVFFLNYLPIDLTLHQPDSHTGISHGQVVQMYLATLAQDIRAFARRLAAERDLMVILTSDHGSTCIPRGTVNVIQAKALKSLTLDEHHRFVEVGDDQAARLADAMQYDCYLFDRASYDLPANYLVARRLYRFLPTDDAVYIHGGLTPEEVIVPLAVYQPATVIPRPLNIRLVSPAKVLAGTRADLVFELTNQNNSPVEDLVFEITESAVDSKSIEIGTVQKLERRTFTVKARCSTGVDLQSKSMRSAVRFRFHQQEHQQAIEIPVIYDSLIKTKFNLDDLF